jgi:phosphatidylglycerol:prolipoprotein diacylglycerol transferase
MIDITPDPVFLRVLGFPIYWYGIAYAIGLAAVYWVLVREARFRGLNDEEIGTGLIVIAVAALVGGRLYHVIDQWALYKDHPLTAFLPLTVQPDGSYGFSGFTGLGVPGGIISGSIAGWAYVRWRHQDFFRWADVVAPALFVMQAIGRWGNFFNQELYGPPTTLPWGIKIDCAHRVAQYVCSPEFPESTHFHPLFLYESISGIVGALVLVWLARRRTTRLVPGDLLWIFFIWYGVTRFALEGLRTGNWTFFGVPTASIVTLGFILLGLGALWYRHGPGFPGVRAAELLPEPTERPTPEEEEDDFWDDDEAEDDDLDDDDDVEEEGELDGDDLEDDDADAEAGEASSNPPTGDRPTDPLPPG